MAKQNLHKSTVLYNAYKIQLLSLFKSTAMKIMFVVIIYFKAALVSSPIYQSFFKKHKEILQAIGIIVIKSSETRAANLHCRYSSGHL